jgi:hypothetical protein
MVIGAKVQIVLIVALSLCLTYGAVKLMWPKDGPPVICADEDVANCITNKDKANNDYDPHQGEGFSPPPD